jgi:hypothetical protein
VRIEVEPEFAEAYHDWLVPHVHEILAIPGFAGAELFREEPDGAHPVFTCATTSTRARARGLPARARAAPARDADARFGARFAATRRVMELVRSFGAGRS